jgi:hypothetical protein
MWGNAAGRIVRLSADHDRKDSDVDSFLDWFWVLLAWFFFFAWLMVLFYVFADLFRDHDLGGWGKAAWIILIIVLPALGVLVYLVARGRGMAERSARQAQQYQAAQAAYIQSVAGASASPPEQVAHAKQLLDAGTITQQEFEQMKAKALA